MSKRPSSLIEKDQQESLPDAPEKASVACRELLKEFELKETHEKILGELMTEVLYEKYQREMTALLEKEEEDCSLAHKHAMNDIFKKYAGGGQLPFPEVEE